MVRNVQVCVRWHCAAPEPCQLAWCDLQLPADQLTEGFTGRKSLFKLTEMFCRDMSIIFIFVKLNCPILFGDSVSTCICNVKINYITVFFIKKILKHFHMKHFCGFRTEYFSVICCVKNLRLLHFFPKFLNLAIFWGTNMLPVDLLQFLTNCIR